MSSDSQSRQSTALPVSRVKYIGILQDGVYRTNPVTYQVLGICIFLAVTNRVENSLVMGAALIFVLATMYQGRPWDTKFP